MKLVRNYRTVEKITCYRKTMRQDCSSIAMLPALSTAIHLRAAEVYQPGPKRLTLPNLSTGMYTIQQVLIMKFPIINEQRIKRSFVLNGAVHWRKFLWKPTMARVRNCHCSILLSGHLEWVVAYDKRATQTRSQKSVACIICEPASCSGRWTEVRTQHRACSQKSGAEAGPELRKYRLDRYAATTCFRHGQISAACIKIIAFGWVQSIYIYTNVYVHMYIYICKHAQHTYAHIQYTTCIMVDNWLG